MLSSLPGEMECVCVCVCAHTLWQENYTLWWWTLPIMIYFTKGLHIKLHPTEITEAQTASGVWFVVALNDLVERCWWISVCEGSPFHLPASDVNWLIQQILVINPHFVNLCCFGSRSVNAGCIWEKQSHCFASLCLCMCDWILTQNVLFAVDGLNVLIYVCVCVCVWGEGGGYRTTPMCAIDCMPYILDRRDQTNRKQIIIASKGCVA